jgi:UDP-N-acetylmuramoyl-tripeptide--D-alanyl-D-alanine ligase
MMLARPNVDWSNIIKRFIIGWILPNYSMKKILRGVVLAILKRLVRRRLKKFKGKVIAVTGSVGKSSTKEAIFAVLNTKYRVKRSKKSMNSDFGLLLTILDIESGFSSVVKWSILLVQGFWNSFFKMHEDFLVLELGVDAPGDMDFLLSFVKPEIAVFTNVAPVHLAEGQFKDLDAVFEEKKKIFKYVDALGGKAVFNLDDPLLEGLTKEIPRGQRLTFGANEKADYRIHDVKLDDSGTAFSVDTKKFDDRSFFVEALGEHQAYVAVVALICADLVGMSAEEVAYGLTKYKLPPGRMNLIEGKNEVLIIDSSYNSSPLALFEALKVLRSVAKDRAKVAVLGNMNELGDDSKLFHEQIGEVVASYTDKLITVGGQAKYIAEKAVESGMPADAVVALRDVKEAIEFFETNGEKDCVMLVKGSQNQVRLEKLIKTLMARPEEAKDVLVRQGRGW